MPKSRKTQAAAQAKITMQGNKEEEEDPDTSRVAFEAWKSSTKLLAGGKLADHEAQWNTQDGKFSQDIKVLHNESFTLEPLVITEGQYKGRHILMLMPVKNKNYSRFLHLPPELRNRVYEFMPVKSKPIAMSSHKIINGRKRSVIKTLHSEMHEGMTWDKSRGKWTGEVPSSFSLLRVNKQLLSETAPMAYGNTFSFDSISDANIFLHGVGDMSVHIRDLRLRRFSYQKTKIRSFLSLATGNANSLRRIHFLHEYMCTRPGVLYGDTTVEKFVEICKTSLKKMHKARKDSKTAVQVLDLIHIDPPPACWSCNSTTSTNSLPKVVLRPAEAEVHRSRDAQRRGRCYVASAAGGNAGHQRRRVMREAAEAWRSESMGGFVR
ncbi:hypothetical protein LTR56_021977 [Elasticomyces elasticus]|nr:hypothetical protein LTR56_021977 [Elasticomyces elasticus]KAK3630235.1 hypothetical protein LTR22_021613 [Elasticomyces elasticus]KAK5748966.1 hypothetical protein LTS12_021003 [Elasticomyces elasticus]